LGSSGKILHDQIAHRAIGAFEQRVAGLLVGFAAEAVADLDHALLAGAAAGNDRHEIAVVHLRRARIVHDQVERRLVELAALVELDRRNADAFAEDRSRVGRHAAGHGAADVHHVAEHRGEADQLAFVKHRHQHHEVVEVADRAGASVRVVLQDDVARLELEAALLEHVRNIRAELPDDHPPLGVADHRKFVVLFADHRRHRRAEQHRIHFVARVAQRVFNQIERDGIEPAVLPRLPAWRVPVFRALRRWSRGGRARCNRLLTARLRGRAVAEHVGTVSQRRFGCAAQCGPSSPLARAEPNCIFELPSTVSLQSTVTDPRSVLCSTTSDDQPEPKRSLSIA
jgi:hypothetical protein